MGSLMRRIAAAGNGLRPRIALLAIVTAIPLLALLLAGVVIDRRETIRAAETRVVDLARLGAEQQGTTVVDAANLLRALAKIPAVRDMTEGTCHALLHKVAEDDPRIDTIVVAQANGNIVCNSESADGPVNVADRAYFRQARSATNDRLIANGAIVSRLSGRPIVVVAVPIGSATAVPLGGVIIATLSLDRLFDPAAHALAGTDHVACVINPNDGTVLASFPRNPALIGMRVPKHALVTAFHGMPDGGSVVVPDLRGTPRIFGFVPLQAGDVTLLLGIGLSRAQVLAEANSRLYLGVALAIAAAVVSLALAWYTARSTLLRPIEALAGTAARFGAGDLTARATTRGNVGEIRALGLAFNRMARRLQARTQQLIVTQAALRTSEEHHRLLADHSTDMITRFGNDFRRIYVSPSCYDLLGYRPEELVGQEPQGIVHPDDWMLLDATLNAPLKAGQPTARASFRAIHKDGSIVWLEASGRRLPHDAGYVVATRDISERKTFEYQLEEANRQLETLAMSDPLTGLANRRRLDDLMREEYRRARRNGSAVSLIMIDADRFKAYNDTYGHPAGDECLRGIAGAIDRVLRRPGDVAARYGGEEFAVLLPHTEEAGAITMAQQIAAAIQEMKVPHGGSPNLIVTVSLGVAGTFPDRSDGNLDELVDAADRALYLAKAAGGNTVRAASELPPRGKW
jgi:diguanylate cyclase (GGDEF)-like protein/PAS domain S-box-containing protein